MGIDGETASPIANVEDRWSRARFLRIDTRPCLEVTINLLAPVNGPLLRVLIDYFSRVYHTLQEMCRSQREHK